MSEKLEELWPALQQAGLVKGNAPAPGKLESPWYVKAILAFSGWLAALLTLIFIGIACQFIIESSFASMITGSLLIAGAHAIFRTAKNEFFNHLALAISFTGQVLIAVAVFDGEVYRELMPWVGILLLQLVLAVVMPNFIHRVCSAYFSVFVLSIVLALMHIPYLHSAIVMLLAISLWLNEFKFPVHIQKIRACGYGVVLALVQLKGSALFAPGGVIGWGILYKQPEIWGAPWLGEVFAGLVMLYLTWQLLQRSTGGYHKYFPLAVLAGTLVLCLVSIKAQGIVVGVLILVLGFNGSNRILMGLGGVSLLFYISSYYYLLETTLLVKAQILFITGVLLLGLRWVLLYVFPVGKEVQDVS